MVTKIVKDLTLKKHNFELGQGWNVGKWRWTLVNMKETIKQIMDREVTGGK